HPPGERSTAETASDGAPAEAGTPQAETAAEGGPERRTLRLRNWRRRHRTMRTAPRLGEAGGDPPNAENGAAEAVAAAATAAAPGDSGAARPRHRRRRPRYPIPERPGGGNGETAGDGAGSAQAPGEIPTRPLGTRPPRSRNRGRGGPPGRGRGMPDRKIERKLYSFDSVVDRGFEDIEEEAGTRRVHWTILKRTTADQVSRKPVSAVYVLQRDGNDSEFPSL